MAAWVVERLLPWLATGEPMLVAVDAPLGWPRGLQALASQPAGSGRAAGQVSEDPFTRHTDRVVRAVTGKVPLAVGADRIARTAAASLELLHALRVETLGALVAGGVAAFAAVDAAATEEALSLLVHDFDSAPSAVAVLRGSEHACDAGLAALARLDFLRGDARSPRAGEPALAVEEVWIRFR